MRSTNTIWLCSVMLLTQVASAATTTVLAVAVLPAPSGVTIRIAMNGQVTPQAKALTSPDRIVIDLPETQPAAHVPVGEARAPVQSVTLEQVSASPLLTRVTVALDGPQPFSMNTTGNVLTLSLGSAGAGAAAQPAIAPARTAVPPAVPTSGAGVKPAGTPVANAAVASAQPETEFDVVQPPPPPPPPKVLHVSYSNGQLSIQSERSTLAEVLAEVKKRTGAEMTLSGGTQEPVFCSLGPGPVREVLTQLLTGTNFNFIMTSDEDNPAQLRSLTLLPKPGGGSSTPAQPPQNATRPDSDENSQPQ